MTAFETRLVADAHAPGRLRSDLTRWLKALEWPVDELQDLVLAVSEAVSNSVEHAYPASGGGIVTDRVTTDGVDTVGVVRVVARQVGDHRQRWVEVTVDDSGRWRDPPAVRGFRGRGLDMITKLTDVAAIDHGTRGTTVRLTSMPVARSTDPAPDQGTSTDAGQGFSQRTHWLEAVTDSGLASLSVEQVLAELLKKVRQLMEVDTTAALLLDPSHQFLIATAACGLEEEVHQGVRIPLGRGFAGRIAAERRWVALEHVDHRSVLNPILWEKGIASMLGVPLVADNALLGVLHVGSLTHRRFTEHDAERLQIVADRISLAIRSRASQAERAAAGVMHRALLPATLPTVAGFEFAARYVAGGEGEVGGDWYDVFTLPTGTLCLLVGDVIGHGVAAANAMSQIRAVLRMAAMTTEDPAQLLTGVCRHVQHFQAWTTATVLLGMHTPGTDTLRISCAGHVPPILAEPDRRPRTVDLPHDTPLGIASGRPRRTTELSVTPGSLLCLYSDGLVERRRALIDDNIEKLRATITLDPPEHVCANVMNRLIGHTTPEDDVAVLAARRLPEALMS